MTGDPERPRYGPRAAFALRPSAEAVEASGLAQTALDRPRFTEAAPVEAPHERPEDRPRRREPARPSRATRAILVFAVATLAAVTGAAFGVWLVTQVAR